MCFPSPQHCSSLQREDVNKAQSESPDCVPSASDYILALHKWAMVLVCSGVAQVWMYLQLGATWMTILSGLVWVALSGTSLYKMKRAIRERHHINKNDSKPCEKTRQIAHVKAISNKLLQSLPMSMRCSVTCNGNSFSVGIATLNAAATQIFQIDSPDGIPLSVVLQKSGARLVNSMTHALYKNAAWQKPVGGISFASANLHALTFRSMCGLFTASATLVYVLDHSTAQGMLCLGAEIPTVWQQVPSNREVDCNNHTACARTKMWKESFSSKPEVAKRDPAKKMVSWRGSLVETFEFQAERNARHSGPFQSA